MAHIAQDAGVSLPMIESLGQSNRAQIDQAIEMAKVTGAKRVGILGLAFKPGTDDLRESPILEVIAALRAEGIEVIAHDPAITADTAIEGQLAYVAHGSSGLKTVAKELRGMLVADAQTVVEDAEVIIVTQKTPEYTHLARIAAEDGTAHVIDVVRAFQDCPQSDAYTGIGW